MHRHIWLSFDRRPAHRDGHPLCERGGLSSPTCSHSLETLESSNYAFLGICLGVEKHRANPQAEITPISGLDLGMISSGGKMVSCWKLWEGCPRVRDGEGGIQTPNLRLLKTFLMTQRITVTQPTAKIWCVRTRRPGNIIIASSFFIQASISTKMDKFTIAPLTNILSGSIWYLYVFQSPLFLTGDVPGPPLWRFVAAAAA